MRLIQGRRFLYALGVIEESHIQPSLWLSVADLRDLGAQDAVQCARDRLDPVAVIVAYHCYKIVLLRHIEHKGLEARQAAAVIV